MERLLTRTGLGILLYFGIAINSVNAQFGDLLNKTIKIATSKGAKALNVDNILKQPEAISTNFSDVNRADEQMPDFHNDKIFKNLTDLPKNPNGGYILKAGHYEIINKSYCLKAGSYAPSSGDGYMYAPILGPKKDIVTTIIKSAENHPEVLQTDIQMLLWTIIARTKFNDYSGSVKITALQLLTPQQLLQLEGGALGILPFDVVQKVKDHLPKDLSIIFEAENNIRELVSSGNYSFADFEKYAILAGMAPPRTDTPKGIWTCHPDGYYIRYFPYGYHKTKTQIFVPEELINNLSGKDLIYDATDDIACPANIGSQRLMQTNEVFPL